MQPERLPDGVRAERTGKRDLSFNLFHRTLGQKFYMTDVDMLEYRFKNKNISIPFVIESKTVSRRKPWGIDRTSGQHLVLIELTDRLDCPLFYVTFYRPPGAPEAAALDTFEGYIATGWEIHAQDGRTGVGKWYTPTEFKAFMERLEAWHDARKIAN